MAEFDRPRNVQKARRGGISLSTARRYLQSQSQKSKAHTRVQEDKPRPHSRLSRSNSLAGQAKNDNATTSRVQQQETQKRSPQPVMDDSDGDGDAVDEQAAALLNRFQPRSNSRPGSRENQSQGASGSAWPMQGDTSKPLTDGILGSAVEPVLDAPDKLVCQVHPSGFTDSKVTAGPSKSVNTFDDNLREAQSVIQETVHPVPKSAPFAAGLPNKHDRRDDTSCTEPHGSKQHLTKHSQNGSRSPFRSSNLPTLLPSNRIMTLHSRPSRPQARSRSKSGSPPSTSKKQSIRRSVRSRTGPSNYYAPRPGFGGPGEGEDSDDVSSVESKSRQELPGPSLKPKDVQSNPKYRLLHKSPAVQIVQERLSTFSETFPERAHYCTSAVRQNPAERYKSYATEALYDIDKAGELIHVDFSLDELNALCSIFGYPCGDDYSSARDIFCRSIRNKFFTEKDAKKTAKSIQLLSSSQKHLSSCDDVVSFFTQRRQGDFSQALDITRREMKTLWKCLSDFWGLDPGKNLTTHLQKGLKVVKDSELRQLANHLELASRLYFRTRQDLQNLFSDARNGSLSLSPTVLRAFPPGNLKLNSPGPVTTNRSALLGKREFGYPPQKRTSVKRDLNSTTKWEVYSSWKGASNDVVVLSWSPDGTQFAAGAAAQCDEHNMQYNRNNNLLLGDLTTNRLKELAEHRIPRPRGRPDIPNTVDPNLYMSVSAMKWSTCGQRLYTASYDHTVKIWDVSCPFDATCVKTLQHPGKVEVMAVSDFESGVVATGAEGQPSFCLWDTPENGVSKSVPLETLQRDAAMTPTSLAWGTSAHSKDLLVGGMSGSDAGHGDPPKSGRLYLWQVREASTVSLRITPNAQNIFDISWHPTRPLFATASSVPTTARSRGISRDIRSLIRIYEPLSPKNPEHAKLEIECPALDVNDVSFCPFNENYVAANCTDGTTYVWDIRRYNNVLHKLKHGQPISELDSSLTREQADVGVRLALWDDTTRFYTGSSDGVCKSWNILLNTEDALTENIASFGQEIMAGAFSPDRTNMLIGDACGGVHILSKAPWLPSQDERVMNMTYESAGDDPMGTQSEDGTQNHNLEGETVERDATEDLAAGRLVRHPKFGIGQGAGYNGPWAAWARPPGTHDPASTPLYPEFQATQLDGPPVSQRSDLDEATRESVEIQIQLATARNAIVREFKRKRQPSTSPPPNSRRRQQPAPVQSPRVSPEVTWVSTDQKQPKTPRRTSIKQESISPSTFVTPRTTRIAELKPHSPLKSQFVIDLTNDDDDDDYLPIPDPSDDEWEEDHWWPEGVDPNLKGE